jgi:hypothetical protein
MLLRVDIFIAVNDTVVPQRTRARGCHGDGDTIRCSLHRLHRPQVDAARDSIRSSRTTLAGPSSQHNPPADICFTIPPASSRLHPASFACRSVRPYRVTQYLNICSPKMETSTWLSAVVQSRTIRTNRLTKVLSKPWYGTVCTKLRTVVAPFFFCFFFNCSGTNYFMSRVTIGDH